MPRTIDPNSRRGRLEKLQLQTCLLAGWYRSLGQTPQAGWTWREPWMARPPVAGYWCETPSPPESWAANPLVTLPAACGIGVGYNYATELPLRTLLLHVMQRTIHRRLPYGPPEGAISTTTVLDVANEEIRIEHARIVTRQQTPNFQNVAIAAGQQLPGLGTALPAGLSWETTWEGPGPTEPAPTDQPQPRERFYTLAPIRESPNPVLNARILEELFRELSASFALPPDFMRDPAPQQAPEPLAPEP